jgi:hypothetical protein
MVKPLAIVSEKTNPENENTLLFYDLKKTTPKSMIQQGFCLWKLKEADGYLSLDPIYQSLVWENGRKQQNHHHQPEHNAWHSLQSSEHRRNCYQHDHTRNCS